MPSKWTRAKGKMQACNAEFDLDVSIYATKRLYNTDLVVAPTALPGCNFQGLYTRRARQEGEVVGLYVGDKLKTIHALRLKDKSYLMRLGEQSYVNAEPHKDVYARYINDCINPAGWNVEFVKLPGLGCALVRAIRDIAPHEELFVSYGAKYWLLQKPVRPTFSQMRSIREKGLTK